LGIVERSDHAHHGLQEEKAMFVIAGASGRTSRVVADTLLSQRRPVRVVVRDAAKGEVFNSRGADISLASLDDRSALARALEGASGLFTLLPEDPSAADFHGHRRRMVDAMAAAVREAGVPHVVFLSATAAMLAEGNGPAKDLHYAEQALTQAARKLTIIRASYFQDNVLKAVGPARHAGIYPNFFSSADLAFPTVATRDVARISARLLVEPPPKSEIVDVVGPAYSARDIAARLSGALGRTVGVSDVPPVAHVEMLTQQAGLPRAFAEALAEMFACFASGRVSLRGDRTERGQTTLEEVLRDGLGAGA
jgi:uncharacterized protein YbjT (DUF2867 family)